MSITERTKMVVGDLEFDVDPARDDVEVKMTKKKGHVKKIDLWAMVYAISGAEMQDQMMPVRQTEVEHFTRLIKWKLGRDMKKGQILTIPYDISVPVAVIEGINGMIKKKSRFEL